MKNLLLGTVFATNTALIAFLLSGDLGLGTGSSNSPAATTEHVAETGPTTEQDPRPRGIQTPQNEAIAAQTDVLAAEAPKPTLLPKLPEARSGATSVIPKLETISKTPQLIKSHKAPPTLQVPMMVSGNDTPAEPRTSPEPPQIAGGEEPSSIPAANNMVVEDSKSDTTSGIASLVVLKPKMTTFITGPDGEFDQGIIEPDNDYLVDVLSFVETAGVGFSSYPYEGNEYKIADFPGFCDRVALAKTEAGDAVFWVPALSASGVELIDSHRETISDPFASRKTPDNDGSFDVAMWVVCGDKLINGTKPFHTPAVLQQMDNLKLGAPTFIY